MEPEESKYFFGFVKKNQTTFERLDNGFRFLQESTSGFALEIPKREPNDEDRKKRFKLWAILCTSFYVGRLVLAAILAIFMLAQQSG